MGQLNRFYKKYVEVFYDDDKDNRSAFFHNIAKKYLRPIALCANADWIANRLEYTVKVAWSFDTDYFDLFYHRINGFNKSVYPAGDWIKYYDNGGIIPNNVVVSLKGEKGIVVNDDNFDLWMAIERAIAGDDPSFVDLSFAQEKEIWQRTFGSRLFNPLVYYVSHQVEVKLDGVGSDWAPTFCFDDYINVYTCESSRKYSSVYLESSY